MAETQKDLAKQVLEIVKGPEQVAIDQEKARKALEADKARDARRNEREAAAAKQQAEAKYKADLAEAHKKLDAAKAEFESAKESAGKLADKGASTTKLAAAENKYIQAAYEAKVAQEKVDKLHLQEPEAKAKHDARQQAKTEAPAEPKSASQLTPEEKAARLDAAREAKAARDSGSGSRPLEHVEAKKAEIDAAKAPKVEAPKAEAPKAEAPKAEAPKAEAPKAEAPKAEAPKAEAPKAEAPKAEDKKPSAKNPPSARQAGALIGGGAIIGGVVAAADGGSAGDVAKGVAGGAGYSAAMTAAAKIPGPWWAKIIYAAGAAGAVTLGLKKLQSTPETPSQQPDVAPVPAPVASAASGAAPAPAPVPASGAAPAATPAAPKNYQEALERFGTLVITKQRGGTVDDAALDASRKALIGLTGGNDAEKRADEWKEYFARKSAQDPFKTMEAAAAAKAIIVFDKSQQAARTTTPAPAPAAPAPATPAPAAPAATDGVIIVKEGDSLSKIAMKDLQMKAVREAVEKAFNGKADPLTVTLITSMAMAEANDIEKPDYIRAGQRIDVAKTKEKLPDVIAKMRTHPAMLDNNTPGQITKDEFNGLQSGLPKLAGKTTKEIFAGK